MGKEYNLFKMLMSALIISLMVLASVPTVSSAPKQSSFWIETDYDNYVGKDWTEVVFPYMPNWQGQPYFTLFPSPINLTWWTDYYGTNQTIESAGFTANTKVEVWVETCYNYGLAVFVKFYTNNNEYPELLCWRVGIAQNAPDPYYNVNITTTDGEGSDWNIDIRLDDGLQSHNIGNIQKSIWVYITWYME